MPKSSRTLATLIGTLSLLVLAPLLDASTALAAAPAAVTVQVEGLSQTLITPTVVTTNTTPVVKDGNSADQCSGTSAAGALELATQGSWGGTWSPGLGYSVETIEHESYAFDPSSNANYYWGFWINHASSEKGICETELNPGDSILFFVECYGSECPAPANPLGLTAPTSAGVGVPVTLTVTSYHNPDGAAAPAAGASITGGGVNATTDASGHATVTFASAGNYKLAVSAPGSVRTESTICVHNGNDGTCGSSAPAGTTQSSSSSTSTTATSTPLYTGPYAVVAHTTGITEHHVFAHGHGPRTLTGSIVAHTGLRSVSIELRRDNHGRCSAYDGTRERFLAAHCGQGSFFKVSSTSSYSYLLPAALGPGRYVLDIQAIDTAGNRTSLARGSTRTVFYVR